MSDSTKPCDFCPPQFTRAGDTLIALRLRDGSRVAVCADCARTIAHELSAYAQNHDITQGETK